MPFITILFALDLIITGIVGFVVTGKEHFTALIPSFIGTLLLVLGLLAFNLNCANMSCMVQPWLQFLVL